MTAPQLPKLPDNLLSVLRRIRRCDSDVPAQLVLEHFALQCMALAAREQMERDAAVCERMASVVSGPNESDGHYAPMMWCACAIRAQADNPDQSDKV